MRSPASSLTIDAPAKLNLFLDIIDKRPDGFHNLVTVFERISLCDRLRLTELAGDEIVVASASREIPLDERNIAFQAARLIKESRGISMGIRIEIEKNIPVGAGLAGGSSDAAAVLLGLNRLFKLKLSRRTLCSYADRLGSDVAFFIFNRPFALGRGRGNDLTAVPGTAKVRLWHLLFILPLQVLTRDVYSLLDKEERAEGGREILALTRKRPDVNILVSHLRQKRASALNLSIYNRLSETVVKSYSLVSEVRSELLKSGIRFVHMSGSGPTLFSTFGTKAKAQAALKKLGSGFSHRFKVLLACTQ